MEAGVVPTQIATPIQFSLRAMPEKRRVPLPPLQRCWAAARGRRPAADALPPLPRSPPADVLPKRKLGRFVVSGQCNHHGSTQGRLHDQSATSSSGCTTRLDLRLAKTGSLQQPTRNAVVSYAEAYRLTLILDGEVQTGRRRRPTGDCRRADRFRLVAVARASSAIAVAFAVRDSSSRGCAIAGIRVARLMLRIRSLRHVHPINPTCRTMLAELQNRTVIPNILRL